MLLGWLRPSSLSATVIFILKYSKELSCLKCKVAARKYSTFKDCALHRFLCGSGWLTSNPVGPRLCYSRGSVFALESLHTIFIVIMCPLSFFNKNSTITLNNQWYCFYSLRFLFLCLNTVKTFSMSFVESRFPLCLQCDCSDMIQDVFQLSGFHRAGRLSPF